MPEEDINEEFDSINEPDDTVTDEETEEPTVDVDEPDVAKLEEANKRLFNRAKTAEAEAKEAKLKLAELQKAPQTNQTNQASNLSVDEIAKEVRLLASLSDEEIGEARDIAKGKGISLEEAVKTKSFQLFSKEIKDEQRKERAKMGSSKGSQTHSPVAVSALTEDEHKAYVKETMANVR